MRTLLRLSLLATVGAARLVAQTDPPTGLASISFSAGGGSAAFKLPCTGCGASDVRFPAGSGPMWMARIAIANTSQTIVGVEYDKWQGSRTSYVTDPVTLDRVPVKRAMSASWLDVTVQWYPVARGVLAGVYAKGALGLTTAKIDPLISPLKSVGGGAGIGWDIAVTKLLAITPSWDVLAAQKTREPGRYTVANPAPSVGAFMTSFGLALKFKGIP